MAATSVQTSIDVLRELLKLPTYKNIMDNNGTIALPKAPVYLALSQAMDKALRLKPKYIYTILKLNRYNVHTELLDFYNINHLPQIKYNPSCDESDEDKIHFNINVRPIWTDIQMEEVSYIFKNRTRTVGTLRRNYWTNYIFDEIFKITKVKCPLTFKRCKTSQSGFAVVVNGYCSECDAEFRGEIVHEPKMNCDDAIPMECWIAKYDASFPHTKKRQLKGSHRIETTKQLTNEKVLPTIWRRNKMDEMTELGDSEPPHLPRLVTLRVAKKEALQSSLGISEKCLHKSLSVMKYNTKYNGAIRSIGHDPFFVHYWTDEQIAVYEKHHNILCIDATGSLMKRVSLANNELSPHIFLYQAVTKMGVSSGPVFQMISTAQNTNAILYWLNEFIRVSRTHKKNFSFPKEVITDFDRALMGAVVKAFTGQDSLVDYLSICFDLLQNKKHKLPRSLIRLDICHFMNVVAKWKFWSNYPARVKEFYMRSIALL